MQPALMWHWSPYTNTGCHHSSGWPFCCSLIGNASTSLRIYCNFSATTERSWDKSFRKNSTIWRHVIFKPFLNDSCFPVHLLSYVSKSSTYLICGDRGGSNEGCDRRLCNHAIGGDTVGWGVEPMRRERLKLEISLGVASPVALTNR